MFDELQTFRTRPAPFAVWTADLLWTDPHVSARMLEFHLDGTVDLSSRTTAFIDRSVGWLTGTIGIGAGTRVLDLGCGPGLYSNRLAAAGADVTGVDFSARSLDHARETAPSGPGGVRYLHGNYLDTAIPGRYDVALMIMCDFCALGPGQRGHLLERLSTLLAPGGRFVFDVYGLPALAAREERASFAANPAGGFWSSHPYFEFLHTFVYGSERVTLDRYDIVEADRRRTIYNWLQHYDVPGLEAELRRHGFDLTTLTADLAGAPFDPDGHEFAAVATAHPR